MKSPCTYFLLLIIVTLNACTLDFGEAIDHSSDPTVSYRALRSFLKLIPTDTVDSIYYYSDATAPDKLYLFKFKVSERDLRRIVRKNVFSREEKRIPLRNRTPDWFDITYSNNLRYYYKEKSMYHTQILIYDRSSSTAYFYYSQM